MAQGKVAKKPSSSMDDILSSIRQIIAETEKRTRVLETDMAASPEPATVNEQPAEDHVSVEVSESIAAPVQSVNEKYTARFSEEDSKIFATVGDVLNERTSAIASKADADDETVEALTITEAEQPAETITPLVSAEAEAAVAESFERLDALFSAYGAEPIGERVDTLIKPMLQDWLDQNLPDLVEGLVRVEIERIAQRNG